MRRALVVSAVLLGLLAGPSDAAACSWPFKSDPDTLNVAFPDESATYWVAPLAAAPGTRLVIRGRYPAARYFSFHAYDATTRPVGSLADFEIDPDPGGRNPFRNGRARRGDPYTIRVEFAPKPAQPAPNTLYAGATAEGLPNLAGALIYRVYLSRDPADPAGRQPLPRVTLEPAAGGAGLPLGSCTPLPPSSGGVLNRAVQDASFPDAAPRAVPVPNAQNPPRWNRFAGVGGAGGGLFSNEHVAYGILALSRQYGDVVVFRARAPSRHQLRYWSICQNELATQRYVDCIPDHEAALDRRRRFTFVVSDPDDRPVNATARNRVNWLPWGGAYYDGVVIYRHMLPAPSFAHAWQNVAQGTEAEPVMSDYFPRAAYCSRERFEAGGAAACLDG